MIHGNMKHADSKGNTGLLKSGGAQWLTAGRGVYHEEIPIQDNGLLWGFQLWVNLPAKEKMQEPKYQDYDAHQIPIVSLQNGIKVKIIAGKFQNAKGPVEGVSIHPTYFDIFLPAETELPLDIIEKHTGLIYVYDGEAIIQNEKIPSSRLVVFEESGNCIQVSTKKSVKFIFITGKPIGEPIARHGPFVMNTHEEIVQTLQDFNDGNF
jgi:quercetin 2,3-dioxygenase